MSHCRHRGQCDLPTPLQQNTPAASTTQLKASPSRAPSSGPAPAGRAAPKGTSTRGKYPTCPGYPGQPDPSGWGSPTKAFLPLAQQQLAFLEGRKKLLLQAALRAKQKNDVEGAKMHLRQAKGLEPMLEASRNGLPVDIAKVRLCTYAYCHSHVTSNALVII